MSTYVFIAGPLTDKQERVKFLITSKMRSKVAAARVKAEVGRFRTRQIVAELRRRRAE